MSATLLHSGKTEHFRALGETGQPVYHSALQLRKVISRRLPGKERHLAIPQRDQQGEGVDWYSGIAGDVIPWSSATEDEREDVRIQLEAFRQDVLALNQANPMGKSGDHEVFTRLVKWVSHFPDDNFVYLVDGTPVLTFWGFIHPEADRHANPLLCLYSTAAPTGTQPPIKTVAPISPDPTLEPEPEPAYVVPTQPWWRRWWWLLPLALGLALLIFGLRACSSSPPGAPQLSAPPLNTGTPSTSFPRSLWQDRDFWPFNRGGGELSAPSLAPSGLEGGLSRPTIEMLGLPLSGLPIPDAAVPDADLSVLPELSTAPLAGEPIPDALPGSGAMSESMTPPELPQGGQPTLLADAPTPTPDIGPSTLEPLTLPNDTPDGTAGFLNGNWRGAGVMDSQTGRPLQVTYTFEQGNGAMYIQRGGSAGMTCAGPVTAAMQNGQLQVEAQERARCEDGSHYEMPRVQCHQADGEAASCAASYDDEPFPMQLRKAS